MILETFSDRIERRLTMHTFAQKPKAPQQATLTKPAIPGRAHFGHSQEMDPILHLQRTIGNQAVQRTLQTRAEESEARLTAAAPPRFAHDFSRMPYKRLKRDQKSRCQASKRQID